jgi:hypothetical protein
MEGWMGGRLALVTHHAPSVSIRRHPQGTQMRRYNGASAPARPDGCAWATVATVPRCGTPRRYAQRRSSSGFFADARGGVGNEVLGALPGPFGKLRAGPSASVAPPQQGMIASCGHPRSAFCTCCGGSKAMNPSVCSRRPRRLALAVASGSAFRVAANADTWPLRGDLRRVHHSSPRGLPQWNE